jgi:hypothetical protein
MSIYVCGDIHGCHARGCQKLNSKSWPEQKKLNENDLLIILGDCGLVYDLQESKEEQYWIKWLLSKRCTIAFIDGNHENFNRLYSFPISEKWSGKVRIVKTIGNKHLYHLLRGEVYTIDNKTIFVMGGAVSIDKLNRVNQLSWWPEEQITISDEYNANINLNNHNNEIDFILSHTCSKKILEAMGFGGHLMEKFNDPACTFFDTILETVKFKTWHFGHFHHDINYLNKFYCHYNNSPYKLF